MEILALGVLIIFGAIGLIAIFFNAFGTLIILAGAFIYALMTGFSVITPQTLIVLAMLYAAGEILEYAFVAFGAKKAGASNRAVWGGFLGGIAGGFLGALFLGIGVLPGTFLGIFAGASIAEYQLRKDVSRSLKAGAGSLAGAVAAIAAKIFLALGMFVLIIFRLVGHAFNS